MRVIAGELKGRKLGTVSGDATRPTTDKIKEAVFHMLGPFFDSGSCLDLFSGSGALGIEALSRGMEKAIFIDKNQSAIQVINQNLQNLEVADRAEVYRTDAMRALQAVSKRGLQFDLVLMDPPYGKVDYIKLIEQALAFNIIKKGGFLYAEHVPSEPLPVESDALRIIKRTDYSQTIGITIYEKL